MNPHYTAFFFRKCQSYTQFLGLPKSVRKYFSKWYHICHIREVTEASWEINLISWMYFTGFGEMFSKTYSSTKNSQLTISAERFDLISNYTTSAATTTSVPVLRHSSIPHPLIPKVPSRTPVTDAVSQEPRSISIILNPFRQSQGGTYLLSTVTLKNPPPPPSPS